MQLRKHTSIKTAITTLTAALLGSSIAAADDLIRMETSVLLYSEKDRVTAGEGIINFSRTFRTNYLVGLRLTLDGLTGASPNGALPSSKVQTFTRPSGNGTYIIQPGTTPLDNTFKDTRVALDGSVSKPLGRLTTISLGGHFSNEHDYSSLGLSGGLELDLNQKNTTLSFSGAYSADNVRPEGGAPGALSPMLPASEDSGGAEHEGDDDDELGPSLSKDVFDLVAGLTQVIDRKTLLRVNYSFNRTAGYLTDPYKLLSVVGAPGSEGAGDAESYVYEGRPDRRLKHAFYGQIRHYISGDVIDVSYRYFWDSWNVKSHTIDVNYRWQWNNGHSIQPHVRWYHQSRAEFYRLFLVSGEQLPQFASADTRLASFDGLTLGMQYAMPLGEFTKIHLAAEYYTQMGDNSPPEAFGAMSLSKLFPSMDALMLRLGFSHGF